MTDAEKRQLDQLVADFEEAWKKWYDVKNYPQVTTANVEQVRQEVVDFIKAHP